MTSPVSIPAGHKLVAADFDAYENLTAGGATYTPTWASFGTQPVVGNGSLTGKYAEVGNFIAFSGELVVGSTTTFGTSLYTFSTPTAIATNTACVIFLDDNSTGNRYAGAVRIEAGAAAQGLLTIVFTNGTTGFSASSPVTLATSDIVRFAGIYQAT